MGYEERQLDNRENDAALTKALDQLGVDIERTPEWEVCFSLLREAWPGPLTRATEFAYLTFLNDIEPRQVAVGLRTLVRRGAKFRPTPTEVREAIGAIEGAGNEPADQIPTFDEAWRYILDVGQRSRFDEKHGLAILSEISRPVWAWAQTRGLAALWLLPTEDPQHGHLTLRDLRSSWDGWVDAWKVPERRERLSAPRGSTELTRFSTARLGIEQGE